MGALEPRDARIALTAPAVACGVGWTPAALDLAVEHAEGYPYAVQLIGDLAWRKAGYPDPGGVITAPHIAQAVPELAHNLESVYQSRWNAATTVERALITIMARLGDGPQQRAALERELHRDISDLRESLLRKGIVTAPERGKLEFSVVGFAAYVRQNQEAIDPALRDISLAARLLGEAQSAPPGRRRSPALPPARSTPPPPHSPQFGR